MGRLREWFARCPICGARFKRHQVTVQDRARALAGMVQVMRVNEKGKSKKVPHVWAKQWDDRTKFGTGGGIKRGWDVKKHGQ